MRYSRSLPSAVGVRPMLAMCLVALFLAVLLCRLPAVRGDAGYRVEGRGFARGFPEGPKVAPPAQRMRAVSSSRHCPLLIMGLFISLSGFLWHVRCGRHRGQGATQHTEYPSSSSRKGGTVIRSSGQPQQRSTNIWVHQPKWKCDKCGCARNLGTWWFCKHCRAP